MASTTGLVLGSLLMNLGLGVVTLLISLVADGIFSSSQTKQFVLAERIRKARVINLMGSKVHTEYRRWRRYLWRLSCWSRGWFRRLHLGRSPRRNWRLA